MSEFELRQRLRALRRDEVPARDLWPGIAARLGTAPGFYYNILQVKLHYFTGVALRLKIPLTEAPAPLITQALAEQQKALELEKHAAYIYNELGVLYDLKKKYAEAENYYKEAINKRPDWALPRANLGGLYAETGKPEQAIAACMAADSLKAGLQLTTVNMGYAYEKSGNLLYAEEYYREAININSRHYLRFEDLGYVYLNTTRYGPTPAGTRMPGAGHRYGPREIGNGTSIRW